MGGHEEDREVAVSSSLRVRRQVFLASGLHRLVLHAHGALESGLSRSPCPSHVLGLAWCLDAGAVHRHGRGEHLPFGRAAAGGHEGTRSVTASAPPSMKLLGAPLLGRLWEAFAGDAGLILR